eukprot:17739-Rhodomonas_salina.2
MSGTEKGYGATRQFPLTPLPGHKEHHEPEGYQPTRVLRHVRYRHRLCAVCGTEIGYAARLHSMCSTERRGYATTLYAVERQSRSMRGHSIGTCLRACHAMSGTDIAYHYAATGGTCIAFTASGTGLGGRYGMSGTEIAMRYAMSGTGIDAAIGNVRYWDRAVICGVCGAELAYQGGEGRSALRLYAPSMS